jgi:hypothetical protein
VSRLHTKWGERRGLTGHLFWLQHFHLKNKKWWIWLSIKSWVPVPSAMVWIYPPKFICWNLITKGWLNHENTTILVGTCDHLESAKG